MSDSSAKETISFKRLAPFIQEYVYTRSWTELRPVQIEACRVIFETEAHLLLAAGTASGKTEAAFLPVLTLLHEKPATTIGVLYIGPLKALINDQFERLNDLLREADIPVWHWHGDVPSSHKKQLLKNPQGVLQITPESLESLLINKNTELVRLFGDLRFVIIDELHTFMGSERGCQILCQLERLSRCGHSPPRRIGLSATLGDYSLAADWLRSGTERVVITSDLKAGQRKLHLAMEHFYVSKDKVTGAATTNPYYKYIFDHTKSRKCLIFANNRAETESVIANLRQIAATEGLPDIYHVHHGSISTQLRQAAENAMREPEAAAVTAATVTLELGIDLGQLERAIQLESPLSVSSFLQRLGRSGRRGSPADMRFVCAEDEPSGEESLPEQIPWQLIGAIAIVQLYLEERWIEPIRPIQYPLSLLYHQTMSILAASGELSPAALAQLVLSLSPFAAISQDDFRQLLRHLINIEHIQKTEQNKLIIGLKAEKIVHSFQFYAVFAEDKEYVVRDDSMEIGSVLMPLPPGNQFTLAGRTWEVLDIEPKAKTIWVKRVEGIASVAWRGGSHNIHTKVLERMRRVLLEDIEYSYLQTGAKERLKTVRQLALQVELDRRHLISLGGKTCWIFPWMGTVTYRTLERCLNFCCQELDIKSIGGVAPYFFTVKLGKNKLEDLYTAIIALGKQRTSVQDLVSPKEVPKLQKYDDFIPPNLLHQAFASDCLDVVELKKIVGDW